MSEITPLVNPPHTLARIAEAVRRRLIGRQSLIPPKNMADLANTHLARSPVRQGTREAQKRSTFVEAFAAKKPNIIAEIKFASPSQGRISSGLSPLEVAGAYLRGGATALSILTEEDFFCGHLDYLREVRKAYPEALILQKDFLLEIYQVHEAFVAGADAVLIIVALLGERGARDLLHECRRLGLSALVEVHTESEMMVAKAIGAQFIGINNRSLLDLSISLDVTRRLRPLCPAQATVICESGLSSRGELNEMMDLGCHGFLIGSSLMRTGDPEGALRSLLDTTHDGRGSGGVP